MNLRKGRLALVVMGNGGFLLESEYLLDRFLRRIVDVVGGDFDVYLGDMSVNAVTTAKELLATDNEMLKCGKYLGAGTKIPEVLEDVRDLAMAAGKDYDNVILLSNFFMHIPDRKQEESLQWLRDRGFVLTSEQRGGSGTGVQSTRMYGHELNVRVLDDFQFEIMLSNHESRQQ